MVNGTPRSAPIGPVRDGLPPRFGSWLAWRSSRTPRATFGCRGAILASTIGRSTRTARRLLGELRAVGYCNPGKGLQRSRKKPSAPTRKKLAAISVKRSRKSVHTPSEQPKTLNGPLTNSRSREPKAESSSATSNDPESGSESGEASMTGAQLQLIPRRPSGWEPPGAAKSRH